MNDAATVIAGSCTRVNVPIGSYRNSTAPLAQSQLSVRHFCSSFIVSAIPCDCLHTAFLSAAAFLSQATADCDSSISRQHCCCACSFAQHVQQCADDLNMQVTDEAFTESQACLLRLLQTHDTSWDPASVKVNKHEGTDTNQKLLCPKQTPRNTPQSFGKYQHQCSSSQCLVTF